MRLPNRPFGARPPERVSEYFDFKRFPEKADRKVTRLELMAILDQIERTRTEGRWFRRLWRWLRRPVGSGPITANPLTKGEAARGEGRPSDGAAP